MTLSILPTLSVDGCYPLPVDRVWALIGLLNKTYQSYIRDGELVG
jgi:hypothetical protein